MYGRNGATKKPYKSTVFANSNNTKKDLANSSDNALYILRKRVSEHSGAFALVLGTDHLLKRKQKNYFNVIIFYTFLFIISAKVFTT